MKIIFTFISFIFLFNLSAQFTDTTTMRTIINARGAFEGDMYLDTAINEYRIGLTHGIMGKLTDDQNIDSLKLINKTSLAVYIEDGIGDTVDISSIYDSILGRRQWEDGDSIGISGLIYALQAEANGATIVITDNGRIGIGTTTPDKELDVNGQIKVTGMTKGTKADSLVVWNTTDSTYYYLPIEDIIPQSSELFFSAEYAGASLDTINGTAGRHLGYMTSNNTGAPTYMNYYEWTTENIPTTQDYDVILRFKVPNNFSSWGTNTIANQAEANGSVSVQVQNVTQAVNITPLTNVTNGAFTNTSLNMGTLATNPGDIIVIIITLKSNSTDFARVGDIVLNYNL